VVLVSQLRLRGIGRGMTFQSRFPRCHTLPSTEGADARERVFAILPATATAGCCATAESRGRHHIEHKVAQAADDSSGLISSLDADAVRRRHHRVLRSRSPASIDYTGVQGVPRRHVVAALSIGAALVRNSCHAEETRATLPPPIRSQPDGTGASTLGYSRLEAGAHRPHRSAVMNRRAAALEISSQSRANSCVYASASAAASCLSPIRREPQLPSLSAWRRSAFPRPRRRRP